ncbi:hypothetical protein ACTRW9_12610 [Nitrospina sp. 32_T5]|uniref:hypothetical protein n=1 Tax=unclassified Nitrospina TaxID=2638683 RepID=UPI003F9B5536
MRSAGEGAKAFAIWGALGFLLVVPLLFIDWTNPPAYPRLEQAVKVVRYLSSPRQVSRSSFSAMFPDQRPTEFVKWMFSTVGKANWPPSENGHGDEVEAAKSLRIPLIPKDTLIVPGQPHLNKAGRQLVIKGDDRRGVLVAEAHFDSRHPPVFTREIPFNPPK